MSSLLLVHIFSVCVLPSLLLSYFLQPFRPFPYQFFMDSGPIYCLALPPVVEILAPDGRRKPVFILSCNLKPILC